MRTPAALVLAASFTASAVAQPDEPTLFVAHYYALGATVATFIINDDGTLTQADNEPSGVWSDALGISPSGEFLMVGNPAGSDDGMSTQDEVYLFRVNADSTLTQIGSAIVPDSPNAIEWIDNDTVIINDSDLSNSTIYVYDVDTKSGVLTQIDAEPTGGFTVSFAIDREAGTFWANDLFSDTIFRYIIEPDGTLTPAGSMNQSYYPFDLTFSPDKTRMYAAGGISGDREKITGHAVNEIKDIVPLTPLPNSPYITAGNSPAHLAMMADGQHLFAGHGTDATVRGFAVAADGSLTPTNAFYDVGGQGSIGDMAVYQDLLFVVDDQLDSGTDDRGVIVFRIGVDGSMTQVGPKYDTGTPRPEGSAIVWAPDTTDCLADTNGDGSLTPADFTAWINAFNNQLPACDQNADSACTPGDFTAWINNYNAGC